MSRMMTAPDREAALRAKIAAGDYAGAEAELRALHAREGVRLWSGNMLAVCLRNQRRYEEAVALYRRLLAAAPQEGGIWCNLGNALTDSLRWHEAVAAHRRAIALQPENAEGLAAFGRTLARMGRSAEAREMLERALALNPEQRARIEWDICLSWLLEGDYAKGWPLYDRRWATPRAEADPAPGPRWDGAPAPGATLYLHAEQGFGDNIQCLRYLDLAAERVGRLVLAIQPSLMRLAAEIAPAGTRIVPQGTRPEAGWLVASLLELPGFFTPSADLVPRTEGYLRAPEAARAKFAGLMPPRQAGERRVGIVWSGSTTFQHNDVRRAGLADFLRAFAQPGVRLFSLQKGPPAADLAAQPKAPVTDLAPHLEDFADTAAAIEQLDLVIMTDSAVAHLCGALGRPVWVLMGPLLHWPWGAGGETTPWYRSARLFRQPGPGCWAPVFDRAAGELAAL